MIKLKPCPFCGGKAEILSYWTGAAFFDLESDLYVVRCKKCGAEAPQKTRDKMKAVENWNRRAGDEA